MREQALSEEAFRLILDVVVLALIFISPLISVWNELVPDIRAWYVCRPRRL